ncbi:MAG TPA: tetratricopeptide repeat protein [Actinocrinis sp.]
MTSSADHGAPDEDLPARLRGLRARLGLSQERLARRLGVSFATVNRWETGRSRMSERAIEALAQLEQEARQPPASAPPSGTAPSASVPMARSAPASSIRPGAGTAPAAPESETSTAASAGAGEPAAPTASTAPPDYGFTSAFVGREAELAELSDAVASHRLLSLVGPGGTGKTRLAAELARRLAPGLPTAFVPLESVREPRQLTTAIAAAVGARDRADAPAAESLVSALGDEPRLLLLDAAENVRDEVAVVASMLLDGVSELRIVVTSRRALGALEEVSWAVPPLGCPAPAAGPGEVAASDAVRLFVARARERVPRFDLAGAGPAVGELCRRLGGLPLAIELIAGWTGTLSVDEILGHRASLLGGRSGAAEAGTLRGVIEASYDLLDAPEQALLRLLSVFAGSFTVEDAAAITAIPFTELVHSVRALVDASWLHVRGDGLQNRFILLETVREFAAERLAGTDLGRTLPEAHARHFTTVATDSEQALTTADAPRWRSRMSAAWPDIEQALLWAAEHGQTELGLNTSAALWRWWLTSGRLAEGRSWLARFLAEPHDRRSVPSGKALASSAVLANENGDYSGAADQGAAALRILESHGEREQAALAATAVGSAYRYTGDQPAARRYFERAMDLRRALGDRRAISVSLNNLALLTLDEGDLDRARELLEESLLIKRQIGEPRAVALGLLNLADVLIRGRYMGRAERAIEEAVQLYASLGDRQLTGVLRCNQGQLDEDRGDWDAAAAHYAEAVEAHRAAGNQHDVVVALTGLGRSLHRLGRRGEAVKHLRDAEALAVDIANASRLAAVRAALVEVGELGRTPPPAGITAREAEVLGLLGRGLPNREIAAQLHLSVSTVERHLATIYRKLGLRSRVEAARFAVANGLTPVPR